MAMYKQDPDDSRKQIPKGIQRGAFGKTTTPAATVIQERPHSVICNPLGASIGDTTEYVFLYETTASLGGTTLSETYSTGSAVKAGAGTIELMIQPVAWDKVGGSAAEGDVIFVYRGGL